jgi:hypothetical protein
MELQFSLGDPSKGSNQINRNGSSYLLRYPCSNGSSCTFYETTLPKGIFLFELWGSQGGNTNAGGVGGKGGYSRGILSLTKETRAFIHIGGQPANTPGYSGNLMKIYGGYNGGGGSIKDSDCNGGGGGTDIRLNENTLYHRLIVAGGGGGGGYSKTSYPQHYAGAGGGLEGQASGYGPPTNGGKQEKGGEGGYIDNGGTQGSFGLGGNHGGKSAGGGGGWFGGSGSNNSGGTTGGGGGSGYVFISNSYKPEGFKLTNKYYLIEGTTVQGTQNFLSPEGIAETGHIGHGAVRITVLEISVDKPLTKAKHFINPIKKSNRRCLMYSICLF